jgi:hypothetical protein
MSITIRLSPLVSQTQVLASARAAAVSGAASSQTALCGSRISIQPLARRSATTSVKRGINDRLAEDRPYYSSKHKRHGVNVQILADTHGRLLWASPALPGATHDLTAARRHGIPTALVKFGVACYADNAYRAAGPTIAVPFRRKPRRLSANQQKVNTDHARNRAPGERAIVTLKTWKVLT